MRKIFILSVLAIVLSNCEISPRKVVAQESGRGDKAHYITRNGMRYMYMTTWGPAYGGTAVYSIVIVNLTKDSLECEYYRRQLSK